MSSVERGNINIGSRKNNGSIRFFTSRDDTQASFDGNNLRAMISPDGLYVKDSVGIGLSAGTNTTLPEVPDTKLHIIPNTGGFAKIQNHSHLYLKNLNHNNIYLVLLNF